MDLIFKHRRVRFVGALVALVAVGCSASGGGGRPGGGDEPALGSGGVGGGGFAAGAPPMGGGFSTAGSGPTEQPQLVDSSGSPFIVDETAASGLPANVIDQLRAGGACNAQVVYPYEGTVFPVGLPPQTIMWLGASEASWVNFRYDGITSVDYQFASGPSDPGELTIPVAAWNEITRRSPGAPLRVRLSTLSGGAVSTCDMTWHVAPGVMSGALFYNTYSAPGAINLNNGAVMRLPLGQLQSEIYMQWPGPVSYIPGTGPCISCHSISFNGSTIVSSYHDYMNKVFEVSSYPVTPQPQPAPITKLPNAVLGALTPDGTRMLTMGNPDCSAGGETFPRSANNFPLVEGPDYAKVLDVRTGQELPSSGLDRNSYMWMPQFSPNGDMVAFNHAKPNGAGGTDRRELAVMDYDYATNAFSNLRVVVSNLGPAPSLPYAPAPAGAGPVPTGWGGCVDSTVMYYGGDTGALNPGSCTGPCYPAFPFFTPDGRGIVFSLTSEPDFTNAFPGRDYPAKSELYYVDIATMATTPLTNINNALNPADRLADYFPTVLPVGVGGKFWVFWTSRRAVGHRVIGIGGEILPGISFPGASQLDATKKRIWAAAIDINPLAAGGMLMDPSHPGFYLPGQSDSGNVRAFAALNPCRPTGGDCQSGLDCCSGFCNIAQGAAAGTCVDEPPAVCSRENERCSTDADCCPKESGPGLACLGGYCGPVEIFIQ